MSYLQKRVDLLRDKSFACYALCSLFAIFGSSVTYIAMNWLLVIGNHKVNSIAILMACFWCPTIFLGPIAGVVVDRFSCKKLLIASNFIRACALTIFWISFPSNPPLWAVFSLAFLNGTVLSLYLPATITFVREIINKKELLYANATVEMAYGLGAVLGMGGAGLIISMTSLHAAFIFNAFFYCLALSMLIFVKTPNREKSNNACSVSYLSELKSVFKYIKVNPSLRIIYLIQMLFSVSYMTTPVLCAPYVKTVLNVRAIEFGYIQGALSFGVILGGLINPYLCEIYKFYRIILIATVIGIINFYLFSHNTQVYKAIIWYFFIGLCFSVWPLLLTQAQKQTAIDYQGRVQAVFNAFSGLIILSCYILLAYLGDKISISKLFWGEIFLMIISAILLVYYNGKQHCIRPVEPMLALNNYSEITDFQ